MLKQFDEWLENPKAPRFFIVTGEQGSGKSALAGHLVKIRPPATYHFCIANQADTSNPTTAFRSFSEMIT